MTQRPIVSSIIKIKVIGFQGNPLEDYDDVAPELKKRNIGCNL